MRTGPAFPRGEWASSPLRLFESDHVQAQLKDGTWVAGRLRVFSLVGQFRLFVLDLPAEISHSFVKLPVAYIIEAHQDIGY